MGGGGIDSSQGTPGGVVSFRAPPNLGGLSARSPDLGGAQQGVTPSVLPGSMPRAEVQASTDATRSKVAAAMAKARTPVFDPARAQRVMDEALRGATDTEKAQHQILEAAFKQAEARNAGVDLARANFFTKFMTFATVAVSASVAAALTVATLGAAAPLMALTGLRLVQAVADVGCAAVCWRDAKASVREGRTIQTLPMGANAMGNLLHKGYRSVMGCDKDAPAAKHFATRYAAAFTVGLSVASLVTGQLFTPAAELTCQACRWAATSVASMMLYYETKAATTMTDGHAGLSKAAEVDFKAAQALMKNLQDTDRERVLRFVKSLVAQDRLEASNRPAAQGELEVFHEKCAAAWRDDPEPAPEVVGRLKAMEDDNRKARTVARYWIAITTIMNLGMAVSGLSSNVIKPAM